MDAEYKRGTSPSFITRIKKAIDEEPVWFEENKFAYSFSVWSYTETEQGRSLDQILQVADAAMYRNKERKRLGVKPL